MKFTKLDIWGCFLLHQKIYKDTRGSFTETWNENEFNDVIGKKISFVQDNHSRSKKNVIRGLHYQTQNPQGKLVRVISGKIYDVVVDLRVSSPTFKKWIGLNLSSTKNDILWVPPGCAHGFLVLTNFANVAYKATQYWSPEYERSLFWNDTAIAIDWPLTSEPIISLKDEMGHAFSKTKFFK